MTGTYAPTSGFNTFREEWGVDQAGRQRWGTNVEVDTALDALQALVDHLSPDRGYRLSFVPDGTAATSFATRQVVVTAQALARKSGSFDEAVSVEGWAITAGFVAHEVSHIRYGQDTAKAVDARWPHTDPDHALAHACSNLLDDLRIEARFAADFPGFGAIFHDVRKWVAEQPGSKANERRLQHAYGAPSADDVFNLVIGFTRLFWAGHHASVAAWADQWAVDYVVDDTTSLHIAGVEAFIAYLQTFGQAVPPTQTQTPPTSGGNQPPTPGGVSTGQPGQDISQPQPGQPGEGKGDGESKPTKGKHAFRPMVQTGFPDTLAFAAPASSLCADCGQSADHPDHDLSDKPGSGGGNEPGGAQGRRAQGRGSRRQSGTGRRPADRRAG